MIGKKISHYEILEKLGEGGMGMVFKVRDTQQNNIVALKVLARHTLLLEDINRRFQREASAGMKLAHRNVVKIFEVGEADGECFISMEYVEGKTLRQLLQDKPLKPKKVVDISLAVCEALKEAHKMGIIHRDIKGDNIMVNSQGTVKVMDFGLAKIQGASMLTREGDMLGTPAYMSPQQAIGEVIDHRSDFFSLGVVLYELLTGQMPFTGDYEMAVLYAIANEEPIELKEINEDVPEPLEQVVMKALQKEPQHRYQTAEEFIADLRKIKAFLEGKRGEPLVSPELVAKVGRGRAEVTSISVKSTDRRSFQARLAGREEQFETLKTLLGRTILGEGQTVFIAGEAGIGKTRLVAELEKYSRTMKIRMLTGRCLFRQGSSPYQPFVEAIRMYLDIQGATSDKGLEKFIKHQAPELTPILPVIRVFLNVKENFVIESKEQIWHAIFRLIVKISEERPLILFMDDLHWADEDTLDLFHHTARNTAHYKVMMIGTYRPEDIRAKVDDRAHHLLGVQQKMTQENLLTVIDLQRLSEIDIQQMVCSLFQDSDFGETFYNSLYSETEGNPFFVIETLKLLKMEGAIEKKNGGYELTEDYERITIPSKIQDIVMRRVDRLKEDELEILEIGAVEGEAFHSGVINSCLGMNRIQLLKKLQSLEREHHIIYAQEKMYRFDHAKIREFLYDTITPELRIEYHLMIADHLASTYAENEGLAPDLAHHFSEGGKKQQALPYLITAGERAKIVFANEQTIEYFQKAFDIIQETQEEKLRSEKMEGQDVVLEGLGDVLALTGQHDDALENYKALIALPKIPTSKRVDLSRKMGSVYVSKGENEKALAILSESESELQKHLDCIGQGEQSERMKDKNMAQMELRQAVGKIKITQARIHKTQGHYLEAINEIKQGLALLGKKGNLKDKAHAYNNLGYILYDQGDYDEAANMFTQSLAFREKISDKKGIAEAYSNLSNVFYEQGNYQKSADMLEKSLEIMHAVGFRSGIAGAYNNLGTIYQDLGRYQEALEMHQESMAIREEIADMPGVAMSYGNLGSVSIDLHNFNQAKEYLEKSLYLMEEIELRFYEAQTRVWLSQALLELGQQAQAKQMALKALKTAKEINQKASLGSAKRILGVIGIDKIRYSATNPTDQNQLKKIERQLTESLKIFEELNMEHEVGRSCLELAHLYHLKGDSGEAQKHIFRAKEIFKKLGAMGDLDKAKNLEIK